MQIPIRKKIYNQETSQRKNILSDKLLFITHILPEIHRICKILLPQRVISYLCNYPELLTFKVKYNPIARQSIVKKMPRYGLTYIRLFSISFAIIESSG